MLRRLSCPRHASMRGPPPIGQQRQQQRQLLRGPARQATDCRHPNSRVRDICESPRRPRDPANTNLKSRCWSVPHPRTPRREARSDPTLHSDAFFSCPLAWSAKSGLKDLVESLSGYRKEEGSMHQPWAPPHRPRTSTHRQHAMRRPPERVALGRFILES